MHSVVHNLSSVALAADAELRAAGQRPDKLGDAGDQLRKCFSVSLQAPGNKDKKLAALDIVNVSIKIYFRLNTLRLCKNLIRTVDSRQVHQLALPGWRCAGNRPVACLSIAAHARPSTVGYF
jgi:hypothetical protein